MVKSIIRRIIISIGVIFGLSFLSQYFDFLNIILPVNAATATPGWEIVEPIIGINSSTGSSSTITEMHGLKSNVFIEGAYEYPSFGLFQYGILSSQCNDSSGLCPLTYTPIPQYYSDTLTGGTFELQSSDTTGAYVYGSNIYYNFDDSIEIKNGNHYSLLLLIEKSSGITFRSTEPNISLSTINITDDLSHNYNINVIDNVSNVEIKWNRFETPSSHNDYAFLQLDFDIDNVNYNHIYLQDLYLTFSDGDNPTNVQPLPLNYLMFANGSESHSYSIKSYFIENGDFQFWGWNCINNNCVYFSENTFLEGWDYVYDSDIQVFDSVPQCSDNDIICHIKQVFEMMKSFFVRVSNFFRDLFDDSISWNLDYNSDMTPVSDLLTMPLNLINAFLYGFSGTCSSYSLPELYGHSITFPCLNLESTLGTGLWVVIDLLCSGFMCFNIGRLIITFFDKSTSLDDMFSLMYHVHSTNMYEQNSDEERR